VYYDQVEQGGDPVSVEVDARGRFADVTLAGLDDGLREAAALAEAFDTAYAAALVARAPRAPESLAGARPTGPVLLGRPSAPDPSGGPHWDLIDAGGGASGELSPVGTSDNECLRVRLEPAGSRGRLVDIDPGWLRQAPRTAVAAAIHQAFADAYGKRDHG